MKKPTPQPESLLDEEFFGTAALVGLVASLNFLFLTGGEGGAIQNQ